MLFPAFEAAFLAFYRLDDGKAILTYKSLLEESRSIRTTQGIIKNDLRLSNGWLHKFKTRHGIEQHVLHREADSVDCAQLALNRMELKELIGQYSSRDVLNFDELALFYRLPPNNTRAMVKRYGKKSEKDRTTVAMCSNMTGTEKMYLVVTGQVEATTSISQIQHQAYNKHKASTTRLRGKTNQRLLSGSGISMPRCTGGQCFSCWTTLRVTMAPRNATMSSWHSCRQT